MKRAAPATRAEPAVAPRREAEPRPGGLARRVAEQEAGLRQRLVESSLGTRVLRWWGVIVDLSRPLMKVVLSGLGFVSTLGWLVLLVGFLSLAVGWVNGWHEFRVIGLSLLFLCVLSIAFTIGRTQLEVDFDLQPLRLTAGESAAGRLFVRNIGSGPVLPLGLEVPIGQSAARFTLPLLRAGGEMEELVVIPTTHRGVIIVGPVRTQRGDPFGLLRREVIWTDPLEFFVHPLTVPLDSLGAGLLRDLEGQTTNDVSMSDLAFHTLREYVPGDERRYIHWRSSAKLSGVTGQSEFLVRQFLDTRRTHLAVVVDTSAPSYGSDASFELALSAGASVTLRALSDEMDTTVVCGHHVAVQPAAFLALDTYSRAAFGSTSLQEATGRLNTLAPDVSAVVLITGAETAFETFQRARAYLAPEVRMVVIQTDPGAELALRQVAGITVMTLGKLNDLPLLLRGGVTQ